MMLVPLDLDLLSLGLERRSDELCSESVEDADELLDGEVAGCVVCVMVGRGELSEVNMSSPAVYCRSSSEDVDEGDQVW
jgi:hypothetical protein